jgi:ribosomal protein S18 acetylase RimI-like enzyme
MSKSDFTVSIRSITEKDDTGMIAYILQEAFAHEPLSRAVDYNDKEFRDIWQTAATLCSNGLCLGAVLDGKMVGVAIIEECGQLGPTESADPDNSKIDPIDMLLADAQKLFWREQNLRYPDDLSEIDARLHRVLKMSFLAVSPAYFGCGIGAKLVAEITLLERDIFRDVRFVYSESSVRGSKRLCERYDWQLWGQLSYTDAWEKYCKAVAEAEASAASGGQETRQFKRVQPVQGEEDLWLQVLVRPKPDQTRSHLTPHS